ncbi:MAG: GAF domain-containing protein [Limnochordales bacterium]|nr:GAF domain-containing protein [Limnochordales bacterium]
MGTHGHLVCFGAAGCQYSIKQGSQSRGKGGIGTTSGLTASWERLALARTASSKADLYSLLVRELQALVGVETDWLANLANAAALLYDQLPGLNWAGFYLYKDGELVLGPFQGRPACVRIRPGQGVCGTAFSRRETVVVPDVHHFPGHIACDPLSRSEIVVPIVVSAGEGGGESEEGKKDWVAGVLDLDSPEPGRFDAVDARGLEEFVRRLIPHVDWQQATGAFVSQPGH